MIVETLHEMEIETPIGSMLALASALGLCALDFLALRRQEILSMRFKRHFDQPILVDAGNDIIDKTIEWVRKYFAKDFDALVPPPLDLRGTDFERSVWDAMLKIRIGTTLSYGELAQKIGRRNGSRAVGGASRCNPAALVVPCHRVVGKAGQLTGYGGGINRKEWLLKHELR